MSKSGVIRLIRTMSSAEKRYFRLSCKKQHGEKDYLYLFDMIDHEKQIDLPTLEKRFSELRPGSSLENTAQYLFRVITDDLIRIKTVNNNFFQQFHHILQARLLFDRSLPDEAHKVLKKVQHSSLATENHLIQYLAHRLELDYLAELNFSGLPEKQLIELQMKAKHLLKNMHNIHEHHSLYELLKYRLIHSGKVLSEESKKQLNDLLLSEMSLITGKVKNSFSSRKLHLLFQSFFLTDIGDYRSALKMFYQLTELFEHNRSMWDNPPLDYLSSLDGILDSLRTMRCYEEMDFYLQKIEQLTNLHYSEYFRTIARKTAMVYQLALLTGEGRHEDAIQYGRTFHSALLKMYHAGDYEKESELLFYLGAAYFSTHQLKKANTYINRIVLMGKINYQSPVYKAARLLGILVHYELNDLEYLEYEIRSYKRSFLKKGKLLKTEKLIFKLVSLHPDANGPAKNELLWKKISAAVHSIEADKYELQLLKYFDFIRWVKIKFGKISRTTENS